jgi:hypothetical protein
MPLGVFQKTNPGILIVIIGIQKKGELRETSPLAIGSSPIGYATRLSATKLAHGAVWLAELPVLTHASIKAHMFYSQ